MKLTNWRYWLAYAAMVTPFDMMCHYRHISTGLFLLGCLVAGTIAAIVTD